MKKLLVILCFFHFDAQAQFVTFAEDRLEAYLGASKNFSGPLESSWSFAFNARYNFAKNRKLSKHLGLHFYSLNSKEELNPDTRKMLADYISVDARVGFWPGKKLSFLFGTYYAYAYNFTFKGDYWPDNPNEKYQRHDFGFNMELRIQPNPFDGVIVTLGLNAGIIAYYQSSPHSGYSPSNQYRRAVFISAGYPIFKRMQKN